MALHSLRRMLAGTPAWAWVENILPAATWKCSLSPSLHPRTGNTSQLMLANRICSPIPVSFGIYSPCWDVAIDIPIIPGST